MTLKDKLNEYLNKEINAIQIIRDLSSILEKETAIDVLALINAITRIEQGDLDVSTFKEIWKL